jgi:hypothetical protein
MEIADFTTLVSGFIEPEPWNDNFYSPVPTAPTTGATTLEVLNGNLNRDNLKAGKKVTNLMYRPQSLCGGQMVGNTANMDYFEITFGGDSNTHEARQPVPGACIDFYVPFDASVLILQWNWSETNTHPNKDYVGASWAAGNEVTTRCYLDGSNLPGLQRGILGGWNGSAHEKKTDRRYSMHTLKTSETKKGWHSAELRLYQNENTVRLRVRNVKVIWFK